jgi:hypothetical protein
MNAYPSTLKINKMLKIKTENFRLIGIMLLAIFLSAQTLVAQKVDNTFFNEVKAFLQTNVLNGKVRYNRLGNNATLTQLMNRVENADLSGTDEATQKAFYINAYNLHVINAAASLYPLASVQSEPGFFDRKKITVAGKKYTLTGFEKKKMLDIYDDPRLHFVLVCGALGCPAIINEAYVPATLDAQLERQTNLALNDPNFVRTNGNTIELSKIFDWYSKDFGGNKKAVFAYINKYRTEEIPASAKLDYYDYDWTLNDHSVKKPTLGARKTPGTSSSATNASRYVVSSTIPKGTIEVRVFNNMYTQRVTENESRNRATFFTTTLTALYGLTNRINIGPTVKYRRVSNSVLPSDATEVFKSKDNDGSRAGVTGLGVQVRLAPVPAWRNFSIQSTFNFAVGVELDGDNGEPYIDWDGPIWNSQFFNDLSIGNSFSLFTEIDFLIEDIGGGGFISTPVTVIFSYLPDPKVTLYTLSSYSPKWQKEYDFFYQLGLGAKYQFTPKMELELIYTGFRNKYILGKDDKGNSRDGKAATYNLGFRFNI